MTQIISLVKLTKLRLTFPKSRTIVLVTGVFDLLHSAHRQFLIKAGHQGDLLLVGLETDQRVKKLKGNHRPINSLKIRLKNLKKWGIADYLFPLPKKFITPADHLKLIQSLKPHILAVSSHTPELPQKRLLMRQVKGIVKVVYPHQPQISTTKIINYS